MRQTIPSPSRHAKWLMATTTVCASLAMLASPLRAEPSPSRYTPIVRAVLEASPATVNIHGRKTVRADDATVGGDTFRQVNGMGTGVIFDERGYVLTNYHVVEGVARIQVSTHDKRNTVARLVAHDHKHDLAVIKIDSDKPFPTMRIGTSSDLMVGETVLAIGNAFGYEHSVTTGIVSQLHRTVQVSDEQSYRDVIQTSSDINPGNSGGPLLNIEGELIAINVAVRVGAQGIAFAIPVDQALEIAAQLMQSERVGGISHGVSGATQIQDAHAKFVVTSLRKDSPGQVGGLQTGDVVTAVGEVPVRRTLDFERALLGRKPGESVPVFVQRKGESMPLQLVLGGSAPRVPSLTDRAWETLGVRLEAMPASDVRLLNDRYNGGLRVTAVRNDSPAAQQGIRRGDVLVGMHKWETISMENVAYILNSSEFVRTQPVKFYILRGNETLYGHMLVTVADNGVRSNK